MIKIRRLLTIPEMGILLPLLGFALIFLSIDHTFLLPNSVAAMLRAVAFVGIISVGQTWLMVAGEIDLSVGSVAGLCAVVASWTMKNYGWPME
ncbi:MAG: ABC transporter permease, partial [Kiritimatiellia bacterium]